jgi:hypothetical protein
MHERAVEEENVAGLARRDERGPLDGWRGAVYGAFASKRASIHRSVDPRGAILPVRAAAAACDASCAHSLPQMPVVRMICSTVWSKDEVCGITTSSGRPVGDA